MHTLQTFPLHAPREWLRPPAQEPARPAEPVALCQHELRRIVLDTIG